LAEFVSVETWITYFMSTW